MHGQFTGIPIVVQTVNAINNTSMMRNLLETALGVHKGAWLPSFTTTKFSQHAETCWTGAPSKTCAYGVQH